MSPSSSSSASGMTNKNRVYASNVARSPLSASAIFHVPTDVSKPLRSDMRFNDVEGRLKLKLSALALLDIVAPRNDGDDKRIPLYTEGSRSAYRSRSSVLCYLRAQRSGANVESRL